ncbi:hypothetical protein KQH51_05435 [bacterium]|nr:hypothetical protein [bacterium]MCB2202358.1 hypothetical protein [bacterium]
MTMKKTTLHIAVLTLLLAASAFASSVTDIELRHEDGGVAAYIAVDGTVRFIHQVEPPKDGKPYRVIVDVLSATHALGQRNYTELPAGCNIYSIRTSQYAVQPEKMVRVVFDMENQPLYSVTAESGAVRVFFTDKSAKAFPTWTSGAHVSPTLQVSSPASPKVAAKPAETPSTAANKALENDRMASLAGDKTEPAVQQPKAPTVTPKPKARPTVAATPKTEQVEAPAQPIVAAKPKVEARPKVETKSTVPAPPTVATADHPEKKNEAGQKSLADKIASSQSTVPTPTAVEPEQPKKESQEMSQKVTPKSTATSEPPAVKSNQPKSQKPATPTVAKADTPAEKATPPPTKTSRFRRTPTSPSKLKGTMVAEFPKRLVIKYKTTRYRDPFATLINETRTNDNPIEQRVPNIEGLRLVGVIEAVDGANRALFQDKESYSYILKSGDKVRNGYVLRVERDRVYFQIFEYGWSRTVALQIEE